MFFETVFYFPFILFCITLDLVTWLHPFTFTFYSVVLVFVLEKRKKKLIKKQNKWIVFKQENIKTEVIWKYY